MLRLYGPARSCGEAAPAQCGTTGGAAAGLFAEALHLRDASRATTHQRPGSS